MPSSPDFETIASPSLLKALCDPRRLSLLTDIAKRGEPTTVGCIAGWCIIDVSVVSRHLATLRDAGVLRAEKRGKEVYYSLQAEGVVAQLRALADALESCCGTAATPQSPPQSPPPSKENPS